MAVTGAVGMDGTIHKVGGIETKLRYAVQARDISVAVIPMANLEEAEALVQRHKWSSSLYILPVRHMGEVIRWLIAHPVAQGEKPGVRDMTSAVTHGGNGYGSPSEVMTFFASLCPSIQHCYQAGNMCRCCAQTSGQWR